MPRRKRRRTLPWWTYLWPGLPHLWLRGSLAGLTLALAFSVLLNVLILATLVWPAWLETRLRLWCGAGVLALWIAAIVETRGELRRQAAEREAADGDDQNTEPAEESPADDRLREAQHQYLRGQWPDAQRTLRTALRRDRRDAELRLWYAMALRRGGRPASALRQLDRLGRYDDASRWREEIARERRAIEQAEEPTIVAPADDRPTIKPTQPDTQTTPLRHREAA